MKQLSVVFLSALLVCLFFGRTDAQPTKITIQKTGHTFAAENSPELQALLDNAVAETVRDFASKNIKAENIAATVIDLRDPKNLKTASYRGEQKIYPASVVKMFYLAALHDRLEKGKVKLTPELTRGLRDMIVDSSNEATQYILDVLTDTASGGELPEDEFKIWSYKRNAVNRYFAGMGYTNINVNQKTFCEDAYGREQQFRNYKGENRNMLTTNATARLLAEIALRKSVTTERSSQMMDLMKRDFSGTSADNDDQAHGFTGIALINRKMSNAKLWSKAGWTSKTRHDAAYIETPDGKKFVIVIFTENMANEREIIPTIAGKIMDGMQKTNNEQGSSL